MKKVRSSFSIILSLGLLSSSIGYFSMQNSNAYSKINLKRVSGVNRYQTSTEVSKILGNKYKKVILANGNQYPDALSGGILVTSESPLILTDGKILTKEAKEAINNSDEVVILGGENSISSELEKSIGKKTTRIAGKNRYETSVKIAESLNKDEVIIASGEKFPDALSATSLSQKYSKPIILTQEDTMPDIVDNFINARSIKKVTIIGGEKSVSKNIENKIKSKVEKVDRIAGSNRYDTSMKILKQFGNYDKLIIASGEGFADALSSTSLIAKYKSPILLTDSNNQSETKRNIEEATKNVKDVFIIGGVNSISNNTEKILAKNEKNNDLNNNRASFTGTISGGGKSESSSISKPGGTSEIKPGGTSETKPGGTSETKPGGTSETKPGGTSETNPGGTSETKPDGTSETKSDGTSETKPDGTSETKPGGTSETKPGGTSETKPDGTSETKPGGTSETKPGGTSETKPDGTSETKPDGTSETKPGGTSETKPDGTSETKPGGTSETKPGGTSAGNINDETLSKMTDEQIREMFKNENVLHPSSNQLMKVTKFDKSTGTIEELEMPSAKPAILYLPEKIEGVIVRRIELSRSNIDRNGSWDYHGYYDGSLYEFGVFKKDGTIERVVLPNTITDIDYIGRYVIKNIKLPSSLNRIGEGAFVGCKLKKINLPYSIGYIGECAFNYNELENIEIPDSIVTIEPYAFGHNKLKKIILPSKLHKLDGFTGNENLKNITIPNSVTEIGDGAFSHCDIRDLNIPNSVTKIGDLAFFMNRNLKDVIISNSVTEIGDDVFNYCDIRELKIPYGVRYLSGFNGNPRLKKVTIPSSVEVIGYRAFNFCDLSDITIPSSVREIGHSAFACNDNLLSVTIPGNVIKLGVDAFSICSNLKSIVIEDGVREIGDGAFFLTSIKEIVIPKSVQKIGSEAFNKGTPIKKVVIPSSLTDIAEDAFPSDCKIIRSN